MNNNLNNNLNNNNPYERSFDNYRPDKYGPDNYRPDKYGPDNYRPDNYGPDYPASGYGKTNEKDKEYLKKLKKKEEKKREENEIDNILKNSFYKYSADTGVGKELFPQILHYSKLLKDENNKPEEKKGMLLIQPFEGNLDFTENIKEKYKINELLFIDTGEIKKLPEDFSKNNNIEETNSKSPKKPDKYIKIRYKTLIKSLNATQHDHYVPAPHFPILSILNLSIKEYTDLDNIYVSMKETPNEEKIILKIKTDLFKKNPKLEKIKQITEKIDSFYTVLKKMINVKFDETIFIPDEKALFILIHHLIIEKSFWMLFSNKNEGFLIYVMERILEIIDENASEKLYNSFENKDKNTIFSFFEKAHVDDLIILYILIGSKGIIKFLLVSAIYIVKCDAVGKCLNFTKFLTEVINDLPRLTVITNNFKEKVKLITSNFETNSIDIYDIFIKYIREEYKTIHSKMKKDIKDENKKDKNKEIEKIQNNNFEKYKKIRKKQIEKTKANVDKMFDAKNATAKKITNAKNATAKKITNAKNATAKKITNAKNAVAKKITNKK